MRATIDFVTLEVNASMKGMPISLGWESSTSTFICRADSLMMIHETVDPGHRLDPSLTRSNPERIDHIVGER